MASESMQDRKRILEHSMDALCQKMKPDKVIQYLRNKNILTRKENDRFLQISSDQMKTRELLYYLMNCYIPSIHQLKVAMIKSGQSELLQYLVGNDNKDEDDDDLMKSYDGRCFIHLQDNCYVVAKNIKDRYIFT